jgi:hypothetical protein
VLLLVKEEASVEKRKLPETFVPHAKSQKIYASQMPEVQQTPAEVWYTI